MGWLDYFSRSDYWIGVAVDTAANGGGCNTVPPIHT